MSLNKKIRFKIYFLMIKKQSLFKDKISNLKKCSYISKDQLLF